MFKKLARMIFGSRNQRAIKKYAKSVKKINALEASYEQLSDAELKAKTSEFRERYKKGESLDSLLIEAFAVVREASKRVLGMRHFDVQLIGGMVLHQGKIAEMRTGEGKTLVSTLPAYLNAITERGVHLVTVNDYLAKRDAEWMGPVHEFLGLSVGVNLPNMSPDEKRAAYAADITYGTNNEYGFDYLRDNMAFSMEDKVQRELHYAIIDEVDSILIDEARTPLIISGPSEDSADLYQKINTVIPKLVKGEEEKGDGDYYLDEKNRQAFLTEAGHQHVEELLAEVGLLQADEGLYDVKNISLNHYVNAALRAHGLYQRDVDYIVKDNEVVIVDEHTGRTMPGRRWSEGLHQAVEAKEGVAIQQENQTLASITFQNYFRLYEKLSGMTGTADTEAYEFQTIYALEVLVVPTNRPMVRKDQADKVFLTQRGKFMALVKEIQERHQKGQPILVGTAAIETSELLSHLLQQAKIPHQVLNAKFHEKEANIIAEAGRPGAVTIATNMAGRGTDIVLGGNVEVEIAELNNPTQADIDRLKSEWKTNHQIVLDAGGLAVLGSERHESRRIDNQLRGRSGRQGDPGASVFYLSLEDNLMRIFASPRVAGLMQKLGMKEDEAIEHGLVTRAIASAQRKVEGYHFDMRKQLLEYDDVANEQRKVVYAQRNELLGNDDILNELKAMRTEVIEDVINQHIPPDSLEEQWDVEGLERQLAAEFGLHVDIKKRLSSEQYFNQDEIRQWVLKELEKIYADKQAMIGDENMQHLTKGIMLQILDSHWRDHLSAMDHLRQGIHLRGYAQKNPKQEYKREAYNLFVSMLDNIKHEVIGHLSSMQVNSANDVDVIDQQRRQAIPINVQYQHDELDEASEAGVVPDQQDSPAQPSVAMPNDVPKVGRNDPCPCGSGKKYKHCHGQF
ncbi:MAG: preprotein translocase subunit SecA [Legionellaceae bacterium]|nr:preprotein translocase subunit SecA [Legionellaceae bacterium]